MSLEKELDERINQMWSQVNPQRIPDLTLSKVMADQTLAVLTNKKTDELAPIVLSTYCGRQLTSQLIELHRMARNLGHAEYFGVNGLPDDNFDPDNPLVVAGAKFALFRHRPLEAHVLSGNYSVYEAFMWVAPSFVCDAQVSPYCNGESIYDLFLDTGQFICVYGCCSRCLKWLETS